MSDLTKLNAEALAIRVTLVKERVLDDAAGMSAPFDPTDALTAKTPAQIAAELADTVAVLEECIRRLSGPQS